MSSIAVDRPGFDVAEEPCRACGSHGVQIFYRVDAVPTNSCILLDSEEEARAYPQGRVDLGFCPTCGFIYNTAFDPKLTEYSGRYEETQGFSGTFNRFHRQLAERLIHKHGLNGKRVLEIGCGKGEFLALLAEMADIDGVGFDPGYREERFPAHLLGKLRFIKDFYSEHYVDYDPEFVCCKMTLEHIERPGDFVGMVNRAVAGSEHPTIFFQIPEALRILDGCAFEDIYYEHCSYFTPGSLARLFRRAGFRVTDLDTEYDDQYLTIEAEPGEDTGVPFDREESVAELEERVRTFSDRTAEAHREWKRLVDDSVAAGKKVVLWGSGSKAVSFITTLGFRDEIEAAVDINPYRQGHYMPTSAHRIVGPDELQDIRPDVVIIMNRVYRDEIASQLDSLGLAPEIHAL